MKIVVFVLSLGVMVASTPTYYGPVSTRVPINGYLPQNIHYVQGDGNGIYPQQEQKHFYYYSIPDDKTPVRLRVHVVPSSSRNTNVLFVKTPTPGPVVPEIIASPHQAEEKTKVYVLVKNQEQPTPVKVSVPVSVKSHPEVYVVKYNNEYEAKNVVAGYHSEQPLGAHVDNLGDQNRFISSLYGNRKTEVPYNNYQYGYTYGAPNVGIQGGSVGGRFY